ncbi:variable surface protein, partial [Plasmodium gonderi]
YVNYWIKMNDDEVLIWTHDTPLSKYLKDFAMYYISVPNNMKFTCQIEDINNEIFEKKVKLYKMYDYYTSLVYSITTDPSVCVYVEKIIKLYDELLSTIENNQDDSLRVKLNNFRCLLDNSKFSSNNKCGKKFSDLNEHYRSINYQQDCNTLKQSRQVDDQFILQKENIVNTLPAYNTSKKVIIITVLVIIAIVATFLYL